MTEVKVKTHLIITDIHNEYEVHWCGRMKDADPVIKDGMPVFIIQGQGTWLEMNTWDFKEIERICKKITNLLLISLLLCAQMSAYSGFLNGENNLRVAKTKWPVSAMVMAAWMVSRSRISPISTTSGSSRRAERKAAAKLKVS